MASGTITAFLIVSTPGVYVCYFNYYYVTLSNFVTFTVIPKVEDSVQLYNEIEYCPHATLADEEWNTVVELTDMDDIMKNDGELEVCGYLGTRNLVQTSFILQYIVSLSNLLNDNFLSSAVPVMVGFLYEDDYQYFIRLQSSDYVLKSLSPYLGEYRWFYDRMSDLQPPRTFGRYMINYFRNGSLWNYHPAVIATLLPGFLSISDSTCSFIGCLSQNRSCHVSCTLRSEDGYLLTHSDESLTLIASFSNVHKLESSISFEETYLMTNNWNGTFSIDLTIVWCGELYLRIRDDRTGEYFMDTFRAEIPLLSLDYTKSSCNTTIPESLEVGDVISFGVLLYDSNSNIYCLESYWNESDVHVYLDIEMESITHRFEFSKSSCLNGSFSLSYTFVQYGDVTLSVTVKEDTETLLLSPTILHVILPGCTQDEEAPYQCYKQPTATELEGRVFAYECMYDEYDCELISSDRCLSSESYCWGYGEYRPSCTSALSNELSCSCTHYSCVTGQCYRMNGFCPLDIYCSEGETLCLDYQCVPDASFCPNTIACPTSTLLCGDLKHCGLSRDECSVFSTRSCPSFMPLLCWDGTTCVYSYDQCPSLSQCPPGQVRCDSGVCRESANECVVSSPCPADKPLRCLDGSCSSLDDVSCRYTVTCPPHFILTTDQRCIPETLRGSSLVSSSGKCPSYMVNCPDGSCALSKSLCTSPPICPYGFVLCQDQSCRAHESLCPSSKDSCLPPMIRCPTKECVKSPEDCTSGIMCPPDRPVLCYDRYCAESMRSCLSSLMGDMVLYLLRHLPPLLMDRSDITLYDGGMIADPAILELSPPCPNAYPFYCQTTTHCVRSLDECPHLPPCPSSYPYRCFDGRCVASSVSCPEADFASESTACPENGFFCSSLQHCVKNSRFCPILRVCAPSESLCSDGSCTSTIGSLAPRQEFLTETNVVGNIWYTFLSSEDLVQYMNSRINARVEECVFESSNEALWRERCCTSDTCNTEEEVTCLIESRRNIKEQCSFANNHYPCSAPSDSMALANQCKSSQKRCSDGRCIEKNEKCPSITICPRDRPIRCMNNQCVESLQQCEKETSCPSNMVLCEDGSCAPSPNQCSFIQCPDDNPILCWDQSCRRTPEDCPSLQICDEGLYFCGVTGRCVYDRTTCISNSLTVTEENISAFDLCLGKYLCDDGSCRASQFDCPEIQCPFATPYRCSNGLCVSFEWECVEDLDMIDTTCPESLPYRCSDNSCVERLDLCPISSFCPAPYHRCPDGLCVLSLSLCPVHFVPLTIPSSINMDHPLLQFLQNTLSSFVSTVFNRNNSHVCPLSAPFLCASGECAVSYSSCTTITPCSSLYLQNGDHRCSDGACISDSQFCGNTTSCPSFLPYMCLSGPFSGLCVSKESDCLEENGCPSSHPHRCSNGQCVETQASCNLQPPSNGCPASTPIRCNDHQCVASVVDCPLINGCSPMTPYKSRNGDCYASPVDDPNYSNNTAVPSCPSTAPIKCWDGICVSSPALCPSLFGCSLSHPVRCANGACGDYPHQYPLNEFVITGMGSSIDEGIEDRITNDVCQPIPTCPPDVPYLCSDMSCVADASTCRPCEHCVFNNREWPFCPSSRPIYCPDGSCVSNQGDCKNYRRCSDDEPYECFNGRCAKSPVLCMYHSVDDLELLFIPIESESESYLPSSRSLGDLLYNLFNWWREEPIVEKNSPYSFSLCSNGVFQDAEFCQAIPPCPINHPKRCYSGECVAIDANCDDTQFPNYESYSDILPISLYIRPYHAQSRHGEVRPVCLYGHLCSDGLCKPTCKETIGCGLNRIMCPDGLCVDAVPGLNDTELCLGHGNCEDSQIRCFLGGCMHRMSVCNANHYSNFIAMEALITVTMQDLSSSILYTSIHEMYGSLTIPASYYLSSNMPFFIHITPISAEVLSRQRVVIEEEQRASELHLQQVESAVLLAISPVIHIAFISIDNSSTISILNYPIELSLIPQTGVRYLESVVYDNRIYYDPLDVQANEICPATSYGDQWICMEESSYRVENRVYLIRVEREMDIMLMVSPKAPLSDGSSESQTVVEVFAQYLLNSLIVSIPLIICLLIILVFAQKWRLQWELSKESYKTSRIRTDKEAILLKESSHTGDWLQIETSGNGQNRMNPLAMKRIMKDMFANQVNEVKETSKKNEEMIQHLSEERNALMKEIEDMNEE